MNTKMNLKKLRLPKAIEDEILRARSRPVWESTNEGVHERVNFDDTIWGFQLAGGIYYNTPLRVTHVKEDSRAEHAGVQIGDMLMSINDVNTATLTIQEAHDIIFESGIEIKLAFAAPDVEETTHFVYQDEFSDETRDSRKLQDNNKKKERKPFTGAKTNDAWSLAWPCNKKRDVLYRESNCFLVPSRYKERHPVDSIKLKIKVEETNTIADASTDEENSIKLETEVKETNTNSDEAHLIKQETEVEETNTIADASTDEVNLIKLANEIKENSTNVDGSADEAILLKLVTEVEETAVEETEVEETEDEDTAVEQNEIEETEVLETAVEETEVEETKVEKTEVEETEIEETAVEGTAYEETEVEETEIEETAVEVTAYEETEVEETAAEETEVEETAAEETEVEETAVEETAYEETEVEETAAEETEIDETNTNADPSR